MQWSTGTPAEIRKRVAALQQALADLEAHVKKVSPADVPTTVGKRPEDDSEYRPNDTDPRNEEDRDDDR